MVRDPLLAEESDAGSQHFTIGGRGSAERGVKSLSLRFREYDYVAG
jgi:hypothetical protein